MIETKSAPESQRPRLITPINGGSYCISRTHLRVEVNTFVMVMIMASNAPSVSARGGEGAMLKDVNASALLIKNERVSAVAIKQGKVCQVLCMICVINFHYKVFINLFFSSFLMIALVVCASRQDALACTLGLSSPADFRRLLKISDDGEIFLVQLGEP